MTRPLRVNQEDTIYHITVRGNEKKDIYRTDADRNHFLDVLADVVQKRVWTCYAYCLMNNHYHLLIKTTYPNLSAGMRDINSTYSQRFNRIHKRVGHLFQGRFHASIVVDEPYFLEASRYVALNHVRAGLSKNIGDWKWDSYKMTIGKRKPHRLLNVIELLKHFDDEKEKAIKEYKKFVGEGIGAASPFAKGHDHRVVGHISFDHKLARAADKFQFDEEIPLADRMIGRPFLKDIFTEKKMTIEERNEMIAFACRGCGYTQTEVARHLSIHCSTISKILRDSQFGT